MWANRRAKAKPRAIPPEMIEFTVKLKSGATYTKLKPMYASGTEEVEQWKAYRL
jgi:hypothetical protein